MIRPIDSMTPEMEEAETRRVIEAACGQTPPQTPFQAIITGYADELPTNGTEPDDLAECFKTLPAYPEPDPISGFQFYPPESLPRLMKLRRYRWRALFGNLDSEGCGWRSVAGDLVPWRQAWYAVNTAEITHDPRLDYPPVNLGTCVLMAFNRLNDCMGVGAGFEPAWGYMFHHMVDPKGILICSGRGDTEIGCCIIPGFPPQYSCLPESDCMAVGGDWRGDIPCPAQRC